MVYRLNDAGTGGWYEPPYTEEEEMEFYRRTGGAKELTIYRSARPAGAAGKQAPTEGPQQEETQTPDPKRRTAVDVDVGYAPRMLWDRLHPGVSPTKEDLALYDELARLVVKATDWQQRHKDRGLAGELDRAKAELRYQINKLREEYEKVRPVWAQDPTGRTTSEALAHLWYLLEVDNQKEAVRKIIRLMAE
jgi:hypothetical protein